MKNMAKERKKQTDKEHWNYKPHQKSSKNAKWHMKQKTHQPELHNNLLERKKIDLEINNAMLDIYRRGVEHYDIVLLFRSKYFLHRKQKIITLQSNINDYLKMGKYTNEHCKVEINNFVLKMKQEIDTSYLVAMNKIVETAWEIEDRDFQNKNEAKAYKHDKLKQLLDNLKESNAESSKKINLISQKFLPSKKSKEYEESVDKSLPQEISLSASLTISYGEISKLTDSTTAHKNFSIHINISIFQ